jgi:hypothetical protein
MKLFILKKGSNAKKMLLTARKKEKSFSLLTSECCIHFQTINFDSPRGGISLVTEKGVLTTSRLLVQKAIPSDSGKH